MRHRSPARWLAPLALAVCAVAAFAIVQDGSSSGDSGAAPAAAPAGKAKTTSSSTKKAGHHHSSSKHSTYTIKSGDVLSSIAAAHGTTVAELQALNPSVDASALHVGQKLRLPR